ncbi:hypothetical protein T492DRAFT_884217, partial [Pavlovales sp. CCMP2436]
MVRNERIAQGAGPRGARESFAAGARALGPDRWADSSIDPTFGAQAGGLFGGAAAPQTFGGGPTFGSPSVGGSGASATPATGASGQAAGSRLGAAAAPVTPSLYGGGAAAGAFGVPASAGGGLFVGVPGGGFGKQPAAAQPGTGNPRCGAGLGGAVNQKRGQFDSAGLGAAAGGGLLGQPAAGGGLFGAQPVAASRGFGAPGAAASGGLFGGTAAPPSPFSVLVAGGLFDFGGA